MQDSFLARTLDEFRGQIDGGKPVPAGVSISAINASLALSLMAKVLDIAANRHALSLEDRERAASLRDTARSESTRLAQLADEDVRAFERHLQAAQSGDVSAVAHATRGIIEVPLNGARAAVQGLELCKDAVGIVEGTIAADLGIAAALLAASARGMLLSVDYNLGEVRWDDRFAEETLTEAEKLRKQALRIEEGVIKATER